MEGGGCPQVWWVVACFGARSCGAAEAVLLLRLLGGVGGLGGRLWSGRQVMRGEREGRVGGGYVG